jgi:deoxyribodipyrimidine photo-lyase
VAGPVPAERIRALNDAPVRPDRAIVLYWMTAFRRARFNFALERAAGLAAELRRPLVVLEPVRPDDPWASDRLHLFLLQGLADNRRAFAGRPVLYHPWVGRRGGEADRLLPAFARHACAVVADDFPGTFPGRVVTAAAGRVDVRLEAIDSNGLLPVRLGDRAFETARSFRCHVQRELPAHLDRFPAEDPLAGLRLPRLARLPGDLADHWPAVTAAELRQPARLAAALPIDHGVAPAPAVGGSVEGGRCLARFVAERLAKYAEGRNHPDADAASGLSPWLHFGHLSAHEVAGAVLRREGWTPAALAPRGGGARAGWWGLSPGAEAFLDQLVTWRELGYHAAARGGAEDDYGALPAWARATLDRHRRDRRRWTYGIDALRAARTHDPVWNAAQRELNETGVVQNYLRMLWGKRVLEWSPTPEEALRTLVALNDRLALDGRDPNSASGIQWCLGRYDRPWGPERPIFGTVRYMSSERTPRKLAMARYLARWGEEVAGASSSATRRRR